MRIKQICSGLLCSLALVGLSVNCSQREPSSLESTPSMETTGTGTPSDLGAGSTGETGTDTGGTISGGSTMGTDAGAVGATEGSMGDTTGTTGSTTGTTGTESTDTTNSDSMKENSDTSAPTATHEGCKNLTGKSMDDCMKKMQKHPKTK